MSLILERVSASYGDTTVVRDVDLVVPTGGIVALIGPNGAGKTTLLRLASGLLGPKAGRILLDGEDVTTSSPHDRVARGMCHIPEGRAVFPGLTVRENLLLYGRDHDGGLDRAVDAFPILAQRMDQPAGTMSGGEQQMLAVARAYLRQPRYVLLDEVSMGLAPQIVEEILDFVARLVQQGCALLLVEQYVQQALAMADLVYVLRKGRVAFAGEPSELDADRLAEEYFGATR
jgi:branched-chain amino acid transport system ATP-binding protein